MVANSFVAWLIFLAAVTPILENSLTLFLASWNDVLISCKFANTALFANRVAVTILSTMLVNVFPYTSALDCKNIPGNVEVLFAFATFSTYGVQMDWLN